MKIWHYKETNGELIGKGIADRDPLDADRWLIPAYATTEKPPKNLKGNTQHFIAGAWENREILPPPPEPVPKSVDKPMAETVAETIAAPSVPME